MLEDPDIGGVKAIINEQNGAVSVSVALRAGDEAVSQECSKIISLLSGDIQVREDAYTPLINPLILQLDHQDSETVV